MTITLTPEQEQQLRPLIITANDRSETPVVVAQLLRQPFETGGKLSLRFSIISRRTAEHMRAAFLRAEASPAAHPPSKGKRRAPRGAQEQHAA